MSGSHNGHVECTLRKFGALYFASLTGPS
ncbi:uncharacterized protein METZ01_LOCUS138319 [marine metagenome]|uniref:Uncharacterized protein n=1 Tax=marine metagenome TaxID=408172 RepID=A0A381Z853_9ZZZZ